MKRILSLILCIACLMSAAVSVSAEETPEPTETPAASESADANTEGGPEISASSAILIDSASGSVLYQKNLHASIAPASLVKIMTVYLACENLDDNTYLTMTDDVFSSFDRNTSHIWIVSGESLTALDLEYAAIMASANDAANMLAVGVSGSIDSFVQKMNDTAESWGMDDTVFTNATGIYDAAMTSSVYDLAVMTRNALKNESFAKIFSDITHAIPATNQQSNIRQLATADEMLKSGSVYYDSAAGGKIGDTEEEGYILSSSAEKDGMQLICIAANEADEAGCYTDTASLFDYGFAGYRQVTIPGSSIETKTVEIYSGKKHTATAVFTVSGDFNALLPASVDENQLTTEIVTENEDDPENIQAYVVFYLSGSQVGKVQMDRTVTEYDTSFKATEWPKIVKIFDYFSIGVLALFIVSALGIRILKRLQPPE